MVHRRVKPGIGYRARLRDAVGAAQDGDTIVVPTLEDAFCVYAEGLKCSDRCVGVACESPWKAYQLLPEMRAVLRTATLDVASHEALLASVVAALEPFWGKPEISRLTAWYNQIGIIVVVWYGEGDPYRYLDFMVGGEAIGCLLVYCPDGEPVEPPEAEAYGPLHIDGRPVAVLVVKSN